MNFEYLYTVVFFVSFEYSVHVLLYSSTYSTYSHTVHTCTVMYCTSSSKKNDRTNDKCSGRGLGVMIHAGLPYDTPMNDCLICFTGSI